MQGFKAVIKAPKDKPTDEPKFKPMLMLNSKDNPEIKDWKLGQEYTFKMKQVSRQQDVSGEVTSDFELVSTECCDTPEKEEDATEETQDPSEGMEDDE